MPTMASHALLPLPWLSCVSVICMLVAVAALLSSPVAASRAARAHPGSGDPTVGFTAVRLSESNFVLQRPYDVPSGDRYRFHGGVRQLWVLSSDEPHDRDSNTSPRTEIRMTVINCPSRSQAYSVEINTSSEYFDSDQQ